MAQDWRPRARRDEEETLGFSTRSNAAIGRQDKSAPSRFLSRALAYLTAGFFCVGCQGQIGEPGWNGADPPPGGWTGRRGEEGGGSIDMPIPLDPANAPPVDDLIEHSGFRRLTRREYGATLHQLLEMALESSTASRIIGTVAIDSIPKSQTRFSNLDQAVSQEHVNAFVEIAMDVASEIDALESVGVLVGDCFSDSDDAGVCMTDFIRRFGRLVHRHPLSEDEVAFYRDQVYADNSQLNLRAERGRVRTLIAVMLASPNFIYQIELGSEPVVNDTIKLDAYELASRLSYQYWGTMPDAELFAEAESGALLTDAGWEASVRRVVSDQRTAEHLAEVFFRGWLHLDELPMLENVTNATGFLDLAGEITVSDTLRKAMIDDVLASAKYHGWTVPGTYDDWVQSPFAFPLHEDLASIYGVPIWSGEGEPPRAPLGQRAGLVTRPAFMLTNTPRRHLIHRAIVVLKYLACRTVPAPPADAESAPFTAPVNGNSREYTSARTASSACTGCHSAINPIGFALGQFDSLGRHTEQEMIFSDDGEFVAFSEIDTNSHITALTAEPFDASGAQDITDALADDGPGAQCLAENLAHFLTGTEQPPNAKSVRQLESALRTGTIQDALIAAAVRPAFREKVWRPL